MEIQNRPFARWRHSTTTAATTTTTTTSTTTIYTTTTTTSRIIQIFQLWYTLGLLYLNLIWIAKFRYERKIEMASARHIKMTHSCSWPVVYVSASISFLYVRKKPLWFSQEVFYQSPRVLWRGWAAPSSHLRAQILMKIRIFKSSWPFILYLSSKAMLNELNLVSKREK